MTTNSKRGVGYAWMNNTHYELTLASGRLLTKNGERQVIHDESRAKVLAKNAARRRRVRSAPAT